ncbi:MAG: polyprenyl synthetase family protein [Chlamydiales bacterium]|nr:polyprenyl synthetase family protein [Chlamydiales bacterium]
MEKLTADRKMLTQTSLPNQAFQEYAAKKLPCIESALDKLIDANSKVLYSSLFKAARYSLLAPGKRLRPLLVLATVRALGGNENEAVIPASTLEMVHTYSLIHDDLPSMDNDDLRRGRPTLHKVFPEGHSILAGDFLLTYAFEVLSNKSSLQAEKSLKLINTLAKYAGSSGLIGGQIIDLESSSRDDITQAILEEMDQGKTSSLFSCCLSFAAILSNREDLIPTLDQLGKNLGLIFQIIDDLLEIESTEDAIGKSTHSDSNNHKATYPSILGLEQTKSILDHYLKESLEMIKSIEDHELLSSFLFLITNRKS